MTSVPEFLRPAIARELDLLVRGDRPELLTWVEEYGAHGARLVHQPDEVFDHPRSEIYAVPDDGFGVELPLWTEEESPSDLTASLTVSPDGVVSLLDVHVL